MTYANSSSHAHEQNGGAAAKGKQIAIRARSACIEAGLDDSWWPWALETSVYTGNLLPQLQRPDRKSAYQLLGEALSTPKETHKPNIRHLRRFGCRVWVTAAKRYRRQGTPCPGPEDGVEGMA